MVKRGFMTLMYRVQQSQALISPIFWAATLTGVFFQIFSTYLYTRGLLNPSQVGLALLLIFSLIVAAGVVYDAVFKLWREQTIVAVQRNPYSREKLMAKEIVLWRRVHLLTLQQVAGDKPDVQYQIEFMERWIQKSLEGDPVLRGEVQDLEAWVNEGGKPVSEVLRP